MADTKTPADHVGDMQNHMSLMSQSLKNLSTLIGTGAMGNAPAKAGADAWNAFHQGLGLTGNAAVDLRS